MSGGSWAINSKILLDVRYNKLCLNCIRHKFSWLQVWASLFYKSMKLLELNRKKKTSFFHITRLCVRPSNRFTNKGKDETIHKTRFAGPWLRQTRLICFYIPFYSKLRSKHQDLIKTSIHCLKIDWLFDIRVSNKKRVVTSPAPP